MNRNWLSGTALVAVLVATPALAQDDTICAVNDLDDSRVMNERINQLDVDNDSRITLVEYEECLARVGVPQGEREQYMGEFERMDRNEDDILVLAELEAEMQAAGADMDEMQIAFDTEGEAAEVEVQQPTAEVEVEQPAPEVVVEQDDPTVEVEQPEPEVAVEQQQPEVEVQQPEPEVAVRQPEPDVMVEQGEAEVEVQQPEPEVAIDAPKPEVEVSQAQPDVEVQQMQPQVDVSQPEPQVSVEQAEAEVQVQTEEPQVRIEQAEPEVVIEKVTDVEAEEQETAAADMSEETGEQQMAAADTDMTEGEGQTDMGTASVAMDTDDMPGGIPFANIEGEEAYNQAGAELGEITEVVMEIETGDLYVVVSAGGFLDIGDTDIVFPYEDVAMIDDEVVIETTLTEETVEEREDYDQRRFTDVPQDRIVQ